MAGPSVQTLDALREAMRQRLLVVATTLRVEVDAEAAASELLDTLARFARADGTREVAWLLFCGVTGCFPRPHELATLRRNIVLSTPATAMIHILESTIEIQSRTHSGLRTLEVVEGGVFVDVDFCARNEHNTGIQRVVRHTVPEWQDDPEREHRLVVWTQDSTGYRDLTGLHRDRVLHWGDRRLKGVEEEPLVEADLAREHIVVPWHSTVVLAEVPMHHLTDVLSCLAQSSPNRLSLIGYDAIPIISADTLPDAESERFAHYLTVVKHSTVVAGISESASKEFEGFSHALASQGVTGPRIVPVSLATEVSEKAREGVAKSLAAKGAAGDDRLVLCVGSHEPRKNQEAVLFAAETLFREGHDFRMVFIGTGSLSLTVGFDRRVAALQKEGMRIESYRRVGDAELWEFFAQARFSVFVSLHEGFGLPVAESLALGTPVLTSDFGSLDEVASDGGCVQVDPRDDEQVVDGMRRMLVDDDLLAELHAQIDRQTPKTWKTYAGELWSALVDLPDDERRPA